MSQATDRLTAALGDRYRIVRLLGQGGMASVYLAEDLKHDRKVAVKVLKPELAAVLGAERFVQEIKTTAALSHPHILPLFDSGESDGFLYYVMPYIEGETIRDRLNRESQLGVEEAVRITREIADALDYAHRHGVIHRDIKPENLLLHDGRAMVMDFGIALAVSAAAGGRMTETGLSLGTPHYMSPEQATAEKDITARSDVYSLASVLYEMLAGHPPHLGGTAQQIIMKIITEPAQAVTALRKSVPPNVAAALARALEKLPADRFDSAAAFSAALGDSGFTSAATSATVAPGAARFARGRLLPLAGVLGVGLVLGALLMRMIGSPSSPPAQQSTIAFPLIDSVQGSQASMLGDLALALADDGTIVTRRGNTIYVRRAGELSETALVEDAFPTPLALSPDGAALVYTSRAGIGAAARDEIRLRTLGGGAHSTLWIAPTADKRAFPVAWSDDGWVYLTTYSAGTGSPELGRVRTTGGDVETIARAGLVNAALLPGGRGLLGCQFTGSAFRAVAIALADRTVVPLLDDGCSMQWSPTGHVLYAIADGTLRARAFDPERLEFTGEPLPVLGGVAVNEGLADFLVSRSGTLLYVSGPSQSAGLGLRLTMAGLDGSSTTIPVAPTDHPDAGFSPDGRMLAYTRQGQIWLYDLNLGTHRQFTTVGTDHHNPVWSPDGKQLAYRALRAEGNGGDVYVQALAGDSVGRHVGGTPIGDNVSQWLPDGRILAHNELPSDISIYDANRSGPATPVLQADWSEHFARVSPDGKWIAYNSDESGREQIIIRRWPELDRRTVIADSVRAVASFWAPSGLTLYYRTQAGLVSASLAGTDSLRVTATRVALRGVSGMVAAMHPDGRRFLVMGSDAPATSGPAPQRSLIVVAGWLSSIRDRLEPAGAR